MANNYVVGSTFCTTYISYGYTYIFLYMQKWQLIASMPFTPMPLRLFCNPCKKTHSLIVAKCWCMNEFVSGIINPAQILEHVIQVLAWNPLTPLSHCQIQHICKVRANALRDIYNGDKVRLLLFGNYGYDASVFRVWNGSHTNHIVTIHM